MAAIIEVEHLVKRYRKAAKNAVDDISFSVAEGEFFALLGPNGAGKTTTVSILTTTLARTSGMVRITGYDLERDEHAIRRTSGVVFQGSCVDLNLTAEENIRFHAFLYGLYPFRPLYSLMPRGYRARVHELAGLLGITAALFEPMHTFSGGMRRKLELVRSLMHRPRVLFLDEPTAGLDPLGRRALWQYLGDIRKRERVTILLTTHYLEEAEGADRVAIINNGKIVTYGTPKELMRTLLKDTLIVDAVDRGSLRSALLGFTAHVSETPPFRVALGRGLRAQDIIRSLPMELTIFDIERPTLEDAYLKIIGNNAEMA